MKTIKRLYRTLSSMRVGLMLLGVSAAVLAAGAILLPDNIADTLLFKLLLAFMLLNMAACTVNQIILFLRRMRGTDKKRNIRRLALIALHGGIVLVMLGGVLNFFGSLHTSVLMRAGETADIAQKSDGQLPFDLTLHDIAVEYEQGAVSQYYADLSISHKNGGSARATVSVNHPVGFGGAKVYYAAFFRRYAVQTLTEDGVLRQNECWDGEYAVLPDQAQHALRIIAGKPEGASGEGELWVYHAIEGDGEPRTLAARPGQWYRLEEGVFYRFLDVEPHVGLMVNSDPGTLFAALGAAFVALGTLIVFIRKEKPL